MKKAEKWAIVGGSAAVVIVLVLLGSFSNIVQSPAGPTTLRLGYVDLPTNIPVFVGLEKGIFESHGIELEVVSYRSADQIMDAMASNQIDLSTSSSATVLFAAESRAPGSFKAFSVIPLSTRNVGDNIIVSADSQITEPSQLAGKKVAIFPGSTSNVMSQIVFEKLLGSADSVELVQISPLNWAESLVNKNVDAVLAYEPFGTIMVAEGIGKVLVVEPFGTFVLEDLPLPLASFSADFVARNPQGAELFKAAFEEAVNYTLENPDESKRLFLNHTQIVTEKTFPLTPVPHWKPIDADDTQRLQEFADLLFERGIYESKINVNNMIYSAPAGA